jgi:hypothetical protein
MNLKETPFRRLMLLVPSFGRVPASFGWRDTDESRYYRLLHEMQRLRGQVYLQDGAIDESSLVDGRHQSALDSRSWHLLVLNEKDRITGCARFLEHPKRVAFSELNLADSALGNGEWGDAFRNAVEDELAYSRELDVPFVELGGWALCDEIRGTTEALRVALATYAFWEAAGSAVCMSTVTRRHCSASILRRIGGRDLTHQGTALPGYFDSQYNCEMELLKFYSWAPNPRYEGWVDQIREELSTIPVLAAHAGMEQRLRFPRQRPRVARAQSA